VTAPLTLITYSLRRVRTLVVAMAGLLAVFQVFLIVIARSLQRSGSFDQLATMIPPFVRQLLGPSFISFMSFSGIVCLGYFHVAVMGSLIGMSISLGTMQTSEIELGFMDLILARPLARHWVITRSIAVALVSILVVLGMMVIGTWAGLKALAPKEVPWPASSLVLSLVTNLAALMLCWNAIAIAIGSAARRRTVASGIAGVLALAMFLLDYVARAWEPAGSVAWLSPFRYFSPFALLTGESLSMSNLAVLFGIALTGFAVSYVVFSRRDITH
jgi:ABC-2 type transport system permease protein